jgi:hypothetical protein
MERPDAMPGGPPDVQAARRLVSRLAVVAVQGEQLQALCDELEPVVAAIGHHPHLRSTAAGLTAVLAEVTSIARDIALMTEALGHHVQEATRLLPPPGGGIAR